MKRHLQDIIDQFLTILQLYSIIDRKPKDYGTGDMLYLAEIQTIVRVGKNKEINITQLAEMLGITKGAISQTIRKLVNKGLIIKSQTINKKEVNLSLSAKGEIVLKGQESLQKEIFTFAEKIYDKADPYERDIIRGLFVLIIENMQFRIKNQ